MIETINMQSIWSPPGKEFPKVITTPEQVKFHLYKDQAELSPHLKVGSVANIDWFDTTSRQGKEIRRIQNVIVNGQPIISQAEAKPQEVPKRTYGRDEDRTDQRTFVMETGEDVRQKLIDKSHPRTIAREVILAQWGHIEVEEKPPVPQLNINMDWLRESISNKELIKLIKEKYGFSLTVDDLLKKLSQPQQADLTKEIEVRLNKTS